jgi:hypothetical protein
MSREAKEQHKEWYYIADEQLHKHEEPYYRACATGRFFKVTKEWEEERERLTRIVYALCPFKIKMVPVDKKKVGWVKKVIRYIKKEV